MGLAHMFLFLYKHNPMCYIYTRNLPYFFFPLIWYLEHREAFIFAAENETLMPPNL